MSNNSEYKNTLNLPKTDFPMKADLPKREPAMLQEWCGMDLYGMLRNKPSPKGKYILHDGPPYANGDIHIGHALNKILKDIVIKYKTMQGYDCPYVPGWDCHGLPVEHALFKDLKINKSQISQIEFRKKAHDYAMHFVGTQREEFKRLGIFGDWGHPYLTLTPEYEEGIVGALSGLARKGYIYRGLKPVNWCCRCETALAEAEVEYEDHTSPSVFVKFKLRETGEFGPDSYLVIWTTTPWTLIANVAVAVHPDFTYSYLKTGKGNLVVANVRLSVLESFGIEKYEVLGEFKGRDLEGLVYDHPFGLRSGRVVSASYVSGEDGTGLVHTAPGHGAEDYLTGLRHKLDIVMPVDPKGNFDSSAGEFSGRNVYEANGPIIEKLDSTGALLFAGTIRHSYPHCWRCKSPIIFRATNQWFMKIDHEDLRRKLLQAVGDKITFIPDAGRERISSMIESRPDWCLSRQRYWGVPIPSLVCAKCGEEFLDPGVIDKWLAFVGKEGTDSWFARDVKDFLPEGFACACGGTEFGKGKDILDVWFDSGASNQAVLKKRQGLAYPADLYLEGSDQHRGWFQASLIVSMGVNGIPPFKTVLTHGFVVDEQGKKMSKSAWNGIAPSNVMDKFGADILRLWAASSNYNEDIRCSPQVLQRLSEAYRKIRNTARFILSNLYDFNPGTDKVAYEKLRRIDHWILFKMEEARDYIESAYGTEEEPRFEFYLAYKKIYDFCNEELSMYYLDMVKGRLYTYRADSAERRAAQTVIYEILHRLTRMMAPILAFTAEEIWRCLPAGKGGALPSVHLADFPASDEVFRQDRRFSSGEKNIGQEFKEIIELVPQAAKSLEGLRTSGQIGSSFDARIKMLTKSQERYTFLRSLNAELCEIFKVSQVEVGMDETLSEEIKIEVSKAEGVKCARCWNYSREVGKDQAHPLICDNCIKALEGVKKGEEKIF
ncbi:MAG: isoleucine--tRNA ligase [Candidatus Omnitrophica bacterium]|nr:isoleucine--tRNA ligase [Candidatus Omnitrophota bacterium]